jgi:hypothetical protein
LNHRYVTDTCAARSHFDPMLQPDLGPKHQSNLDEAKKKQKECRHRHSKFSEGCAFGIV